ncbi:hybrid sensor histidine kinase/response regulator [Nostoc sp. FACHB-152]|uniref:sensor histidine kinase n=1 Tax=unclassified Nostoc TaxID=2593658 RepID=UPI0016855D23|nr:MULTISPECIES: hybrid sensor histidine kinase/response regulator [unclassified Nostoc]MBD2446641.1 hybrid sensor histidine kinase/response regulator [Nostoc sp. FACHB-152]MBD2466489.1 hybrid sensor histidine kinase/response regulator [Nostoc sp. FACHB-145]
MNKVVTNGFILIVDDNPTNLSVLSEALASEGWRFRVAVDGESAIAQAQRNQPELMLLDVQMPGIDGFETCRRLKANLATQNIPIIFTTALADTESKIQGFSLGAVDYIPKPFAQEEVIARVRVHLQLKQLTQSLEQQVRDRTDALQQAQVQLVQQEKLSTLGELIAGIAHEMNNPISFIANNIPPLKEYIDSITELLQLYEQEYPNPTAKITTLIKNIDLNFVLEDLAKILSSLQVGSERIQHLSSSLRSFSRSDSDIKLPADLHLGLDSTLMILQHRLKANGDRPAIEVIRCYGKLPPINCYVGEMNQVFMNILANAIDALDEAILQGKISNPIPQIKIATETNDQQMVVIRIADNGIGIPERLKQRLFEPLFTTKPVGKGTGLGLSIAHQIVVKKHNGTMEVNSQPGIGTEFTIVIPI